MAFTPKYIALLDERRRELRSELAGVFAAPGPFTLEVGCGHGHFLTAYAGAHPGRTCVGIDLIGERIERARRKRDRAGLRHLHFIQSEARLFLEELPAGTIIDEVFILFPDPWPKARHNKHRILQPSFLAQLAEHASPGCALYFRTDFTPYHAAAREVLASDPAWRLVEQSWPFEFATVFQQRASSHHSLIARYSNAGAGAKVSIAAGNVS